MTNICVLQVMRNKAKLVDICEEVFFLNPIYYLFLQKQVTVKA